MSESTVLLLAGTGEAFALAESLAESLAARREPRLVVSYAGRTRSPRLPAGEVISGGFGGVEGLASWLRTRRAVLAVDATHPFAIQISANAQAACALSSIPLVGLVRPEWRAATGIVWCCVADEAAAADLLPAGARAFLALGKQHLAPFRARTDTCSFVARTAESPETPLAEPAPSFEWVVDRGPFTLEAEKALFAAKGITHLVMRNSGGSASQKLEAADALGIEVVMISRPVEPAPPTGLDFHRATDIASALSYIETRL